MEITVEEAFAGKTAQIRVPTSITCDLCSGSGAKPGTQPTTCGTCHGSGRVRASQGFFSVERTCPTCHGRGQTISDPCTKCHGQEIGRAHSELQSLMRISYAVFCLKKQNTYRNDKTNNSIIHR